MCALKFYFANKLLKKSKLVEVQMPKVAQKLPSTTEDRRTERGAWGGGGGKRVLGTGSVKSFRRNTRGTSFNMEEFNGK